MALKDMITAMELEARGHEAKAASLREAIRVLTDGSVAPRSDGKSRHGHTRVKCGYRKCGKTFIGFANAKWCCTNHGVAELRMRKADALAQATGLGG